jgi:Carboxypeptidase regulatory-like domain/Bacterial extracellular solute-binding proteins, family 5 Middle
LRKLKRSAISALLLGFLLAFPAALASVPVAAAASTTVTNPSVIPGTQANLNGPYVNSITYPFFTTDHASIDALLAGQGNILDYPPDFADLQTALSTQYVNVTTAVGTNFEQLMFNMYSPNDPGYYLPFRQAIAQVVNYTYMQDTVLEGALGLVSQNWFIPSAFGPYTTNSIHIYSTDFAAASAALAKDPQIMYDASGHPSGAQTGTGFFCTTSQTGVWKFINGTDFSPKFYTRIDHPTWLDSSNNIAKNAASIGLCLDVIPVNHFSSIYPIVFNDFSNRWAMYFGGNSYGAPLNPVGALYFTFTQAGINLGPYLGDTYHFYNSTVEQLADDMHSTGSVTQAESDSQKIIQILSYQIPALMMWWDAFNIPSLNNHGGTYWSGYVNVPAFGTWSYGTGYYTELNVHRIDTTTGAALPGGSAVVNMHEAPDDYNILFAGSVYDFDVINSIFYDTPIAAPPGNPYISSMYPWMLTSMPTFGGPLDQLNVSMTTPHGYKMVDGQVIKLNFMDNITWQDNVPFTAADYNFSMWYEDVNGAYGPYVGNNQSNYVGEIPSLLDSTVQNKTAMTIYINSTSQTDWLYALAGVPVLAQHLWSHVSSTQFNNDVDPTSPSNAVGGTLLMTGTDGFYWSKYVVGQYVTVNRFPGYFRTNIHAWQLPGVQAGNAEPVSFAITQQGTAIPSSATVKAVASLNGQQAASIPLTLGTNGNWTGSFSTTGWAAGFYEVTVNGTYTDSNGLAHTALEFYGLTVTSPPPPSLANLQVTVTGTGGTPLSGASVTVNGQTKTTDSSGQATFDSLSPGTVTVSVSATGYQGKSSSVTLTAGQTATASISLTASTTSTTTTPTTTTPTSATNYTWYYVAAAIIIVVLVVGAVALSRRKPKA